LLKARIKNVGEWKAILNAIGNIVDEAMFIVNNDGITFRGMDPSHIALMDVTFPKSSFDEFESRTSFFGIRVDDFKTVLDTAANDDVIELQISDESAIKVSISGSLSMEFNIRLIQKKEVNTPIPKIDYKAKLSLESGTLNRILANIERISDYVTIECDSKHVHFFGKSDVGDAKIYLDKGNSELKELTSLEFSSGVYSLEYMGKVIREIGKASKIVEMEYANKFPIHIGFEMPSLARVEYYLAPKVE